jgi:Family of unknown function (DUF5906)/Domain of unknown function (DUF3854)
VSNPSFLPPPSPEEQRKFFIQTCEARNITPEQATLYGFAVDVANNVNPDFGLKKNGLFYNELAFRIPYHDFDWNVLPHRETARRSTPPRDDKGKESQKYLRHSGVKGSCLYLPYQDDWHEVRQNVRMPIFVTEGEWKTILLHGIIGDKHAVVGLSGAQMFVTRDVTGTVHLPELWNGFEINGREVIFMYDIDGKEETRQQVRDAMMKAAARIQINYGKTFYIDLSLTEMWKTGEYSKLGVDDYFQNGGTLDEFWKCKVLIPPQLPKYQEIRDQWIFCKFPQGFINRYTGQFVKDSMWNSHVDNYIDTVVTEKGAKQIKAYKSFRDADDRPTVNSITFRPDDPQVADGQYNSWRGWPEHSASPDKSAVEDFVLAMHELCGVKEGDRVLDFMAHTFQFPAHRPQHAFLLKSHWTGTGKSTMCRVFCEVAGEYGYKASGKEFYSNFNAWAKDRLVVWVDEIKSAEMSQNQTTEHLNDFITMPTISIEHKGVDSFCVPFYARVIMASNDAAPIKMTKTERRTNVMECTDCAGNDVHIQRLRRLNTLKPAGRQAILDWFLDRDLSEYDPNSRAVITDSAREIMELSRTPAEHYADMFIDECQSQTGKKDGMFYKLEHAHAWCDRHGYQGGMPQLGKAIAAECGNRGVLHQTSLDTDQVQIKGHGKGRWISFTGMRWNGNLEKAIFCLFDK